jgi:hypothetical protein
MKLILGNTTDLKVFLLNESLRTDTQWDIALKQLGKGVAARFEAYCNRRWERTVAGTFEVSADRYHVVLPCYPLETAPTIELRDDLDGGYGVLVYNDYVADHNLAAGLIKFGAMPGPNNSRLRFTYTGGYWVPDDDAGTPETDANLPAGAFLVPDGLKLAWLLQCQRVWSVRDNMGTDISGEKTTQFVSSTLAALELVPEVKAALQDYIRYALT